MRGRIGRKFQWRQLGASGNYEVWIEAGAKAIKRAVLQVEIISLPITRLRAINWKSDKLSAEDLRAVIDALDAYRFAPRSGPYGGILTKIADEVEASKQSVLGHIRAMTLSVRAIPNASSRLRWKILRAYIGVISKSKTAWFIKAVAGALKRGPVRVVVSYNEFKALEVRLKRHQRKEQQEGEQRRYEIGVVNAKIRPKQYLITPLDV
jgi:hypothetical protein